MNDNTPLNKKVWLEPTLTLISTNDVNAKVNPAHHEKSVLPHPYHTSLGGLYYQANGAGPLFPVAQAHTFIS